MTTLPPIDTEEQRTALRWSNRRILAMLPGKEWPPGVLAECERLDLEHPGWDVAWSIGSRVLGAAPTYSAQWLGHDRLAHADQSWPDHPEGRCRPRVLGATVAELVEQIEAMNARIAGQRADRAWLNECLRRGLR